MDFLIEFFLENSVVIVGVVLVILTVGPYLWLGKRGSRRIEAEIIEAEKAGLYEPTTINPKVDRNKCIGSGACIRACLEKGILGIVDMKSKTVYGSRCVGHGACARACPVGAIELVFGTERRGVDIPQVFPSFESNVEHVYIAGELGGIGLIRNAMKQGAKAVKNIKKAFQEADIKKEPGVYDLLIVGSGPAGLSAGLTAMEEKMNYLALEQEEAPGGAILSYPRAKVVMTQVLEVPLYGKVKQREISKEKLLDLWADVLNKTGLKVEVMEKVLKAERQNGHFVVTTSKRELKAYFILLCIGRRGTPRKLGVPGEKQPKVMYRLLEPDHHQGEKILVVGGGDSAVEGAMALSEQPGNEVIVSYRQPAFSRIKPGNKGRIDAKLAEGSMTALMESNVKEIKEKSVVIELQGGEVKEIPNDVVFVFAGGELPNEFLKKIGISVEKKFGTR